MKKILLFIFSLILFTIHTYGTSYTWNGYTSTAWGTTTNWTPNGTPGSSDTAIIVSAFNNPLLSGNTSIKSLTVTSGTLNLNGATLTISGSTTYTSGTVTNGKISNTTIGTTTSATFSGTAIDCKISCTAGLIYLNGGTFSDTSYFKKNSPTACISAGGCVFNSQVTLISNGSTWKLENASPDTFNADVSISMTALGTLEMCYGATGTQFNGNISLTSSSGNMYFGSNGGTCSIASGKIISTSWSFASTLQLYNFTQLGSTAQSMSFTSGTLNIGASIFNGALTVTSPNIVCKTSTFNGSVTITKSSSTNNLWEGGNTFNNTFSLTNSSTSSTSTVRLASTTRDIYNGDIYFTCPTGIIQVGYADTSDYKGNISISSNRTNFNGSSGVMRFTGSNSQQLNGGAEYVIKNLIVDKASENITLNQPVKISGYVKFVNGIINSTSTNILWFTTYSSSIGASSNSFVAGPIKQTGSGTFTFPTGKGSEYRPIKISAPASSTTFTAEYFDTTQTLGSTIDSSLERISNCNYWTLNRISGSSSVKVGLNFKLDACDATNISLLKVSSFVSSIWDQVDSSVVSGNFIETNSAQTNFGTFLFGHLRLALPTCSTATYNPLLCQQELICNGGFEQATNTQSFPSSNAFYPLGYFSFKQAYPACPAPAYISEVINWEDLSCTNSSADLFIRGNIYVNPSAVLATHPTFGIPDNDFASWGPGSYGANVETWNFPATGNDRYIGFTATEGILTNLTRAVLPNRDYILSFYSYIVKVPFATVDPSQGITLDVYLQENFNSGTTQNIFPTNQPTIPYLQPPVSGNAQWTPVK